MHSLFINLWFDYIHLLSTVFIYYLSIFIYYLIIFIYLLFYLFITFMFIYWSLHDLICYVFTFICLLFINLFYLSGANFDSFCEANQKFKRVLVVFLNTSINISEYHEYDYSKSTFYVTNCFISFCSLAGKWARTWKTTTTTAVATTTTTTRQPFDLIITTLTVDFFCSLDTSHK